MNNEKRERIAPFGLRLPPDLKATVEEAAHRNRRSQNAEITVRLEEAYREVKGQSDATQPTN